MEQQQDVVSIVAAVVGLVAMVVSVFGGMVSLGCTMCGGGFGVMFAIVVIIGTGLASVASLGLSVFARQRAAGLGIDMMTPNIALGLSGGAAVLALVEGVVLGGLIVLVFGMYFFLVMA